MGSMHRVAAAAQAEVGDKVMTCALGNTSLFRRHRNSLRFSDHNRVYLSGGRTRREERRRQYESRDMQSRWMRGSG
jgi:hypothetical protein